MLVLAFSLVLIAGIFQGTFVLPMTLTKKWEWEHTWATFSLLGMLVFNWILTLIFIPDIFAIYSSIPSRDIYMLILFGAGWGIGAILFGLGMDKLGMALGYPIIMGLIASLGALIPLMIFHPETMFMTDGPYWDNMRACYKEIMDLAEMNDIKVLLVKQPVRLGLSYLLHKGGNRSHEKYRPLA